MGSLSPGAPPAASTGRPKLLFLSQTLPYPPDGGVQIRTYNVLRLLSEAFDVHALCFYRWKPGLLQQDVGRSVDALRRHGHVEAFPIPQEHSRARLLLDHAISLARRRVYTVPAYRSPAFAERLGELLHGNEFDLVHADSLDLSGYFPLVRHLPLVCVHHDVQSTLLLRRAAHETSVVRRSYLRIQSRLMEREERYWCPRVALNIAVSKVDEAALRRVAGSGRYAVVPNGVDTDYFSPRPGGESGVVFVGGTSWFPNRDALEFFASEIAPLLRSGGVTRVRWIGRATDAQRRAYGARGVELTGYVEDVRPHVADAACYVVPLRVGSGTRIKILDAWAMGKAVVSTSIGCEGLAAVDGTNILIRDDPRAFADAVLEVLVDRHLRARLGLAARESAERLYGWRSIGKQMIQSYMGLLPARSEDRSGAA